MKKMSNGFHDSSGHVPQWKGNELGQRTEGHTKDEQKERKEAGAEKFRAPCETHQAVNPDEQGDNRNTWLLNPVTDDVQEKPAGEDEKSGPPGFHWLLKQGFTFPPE